MIKRFHKNVVLVGLTIHNVRSNDPFFSRLSEAGHVDIGELYSSIHCFIKNLSDPGQIIL